MKVDESSGPLVSRRQLIVGALLGALAAALAACGRALGSAGATGPATGSATAVASARPSGPPSAGPSSGPSQAVLPLRQKIARMLVVGFRGLTLAETPWVSAAIRDAGIGGVLLFDRDQDKETPRNVASPDQVRRLVADLRALAPERELIVAIDQEGGLVTRLSTRYGYPELASEAAVGEQGDAAVADWAGGLAATLADAGITLNLAPVVDLNVNPDNPAIGAIDRAFSRDPATVARDAEIEIRAHRDRGVRTALKHFPGLGSATANTDFGVADVTATWTDAELDPYRVLLQHGLVDMVMAAHVVNGQIDPGAPASLSRPTVTDLLRGELGWDGVVVTDDLQAGAITDVFGADEAVALAIEAGCDLLLFANQQVYEPGRVDAVIDLVAGLVHDGTITEERIDASVARLARLFPDQIARGG